MAYKIIYGEEPSITAKERFWTGRFRLMTAACFVLFLLTVKLIWHDGLEELLHVLLPGSSDAALTAMDHMVSQIRAGSGIGDAVTAFCREIIAGAGIG